jgi:hypothetical protein
LLLFFRKEDLPSETRYRRLTIRKRPPYRLVQRQQRIRLGPARHAFQQARSRA